MKTTMLVFIGCLGLFAYTYSFACGDSYSDCQPTSCVESQNYCECADVNAGKNPCLSKAEYCQVFGNVGANHISDDTKSLL